MASKKMLARIMHRGAKANSSPPKEDWHKKYPADWSEYEHCPDPDYPGFCWCGVAICDEEDD